MQIGSYLCQVMHAYTRNLATDGVGRLHIYYINNRWMEYYGI